MNRAALTIELDENTADLLPVFRQLQQAAGITAEKATQWKDAMHDVRR